MVSEQIPSFILVVYAGLPVINKYKKKYKIELFLKKQTCHLCKKTM